MPCDRRRFIGALVVDDDDREGAGIILAEERSDALADAFCSSRAGMTATTVGQTAGAGPPASRSAASQNQPRPAISTSQMTKATVARMSTSISGEVA